jgi:hypothetical protein
LNGKQLFAKIYDMMSPKKILLIILDGWGIGQNNFTNPIWQQLSHWRTASER